MLPNNCSHRVLSFHCPPARSSLFLGRFLLFSWTEIFVCFNKSGLILLNFGSIFQLSPPVKLTVSRERFNDFTWQKCAFLLNGNLKTTSEAINFYFQTRSEDIARGTQQMQTETALGSSSYLVFGRKEDSWNQFSSPSWASQPKQSNKVKGMRWRPTILAMLCYSTSCVKHSMTMKSD